MDDTANGWSCGWEGGGETVETVTYTVVSRKSAHGQSTLQVCQRGGWALFRVALHLTTKERPCHVYSDLMPSKQIIGQTITYNEATASVAFKTILIQPELPSFRGLAKFSVTFNFSFVCGESNG